MIELKAAERDARAALAEAEAYAETLWTHRGAFVPCFERLARAMAFGRSKAAAPEHPSEDEIVDDALRSHLRRLAAELGLARPGRILTVGNAALRVLRHLVEVDATGVTRDRLVADGANGRGVRMLFDGRELKWIPLSHPAARSRFQIAHARWAATIRRDR